MVKIVLEYGFIKKLKSLPFIDEIWLFGSRARGDNKARSDIDLAIICPKATNNDWLEVQDIIEEADTLLKIDCIKLGQSKLDKNLYQNVLKDMEIIYAKNPN